MNQNTTLNLKKISTEQRNSNTIDIDLVSTKEILTKINNEDKMVACAVEDAIDQIEALVDAIVEAFYNDGRLIYMGAGTSGRIGILDAVECRPTFSVSDEMVQCLMAGGEKAFIKAVEGAEDSKTLGIDDLKNIGLNKNDVVVGIAASGRTPYVVSAVEYAKSVGCKTGCIVTVKNSVLASTVDYPIEAEVGQEVITGSTRMKSGTAQKMICNMISTASMIKMGKVYENYMIDVQATNEKLVARSEGILQQASGVTKEEAKALLEKFGSVKKALISVLTGVSDKEKIEKALDKTKGHIRNTIKEIENNG